MSPNKMVPMKKKMVPQTKNVKLKEIKLSTYQNILENIRRQIDQWITIQA